MAIRTVTLLFHGLHTAVGSPLPNVFLFALTCGVGHQVRHLQCGCFYLLLDSTTSIQPWHPGCFPACPAFAVSHWAVFSSSLAAPCSYLVPTPVVYCGVQCPVPRVPCTTKKPAAFFFFFFASVLVQASAFTHFLGAAL